MSACPTLAELFDAALRPRARGPVLVKRPARRVVWEDRETVARLMTRRPEPPERRTKMRATILDDPRIRWDVAVCVVCDHPVPETQECPRCLAVCCHGCRQRHAPDCSGRPGIGPRERTETTRKGEDGTR